MIRPVRPDGTIETGGAFTPIVRRRVVDRITAAAMQRVVLIVAPAGYGKSVALSQFLIEHDELHLRFDVLEEHASLLGFLRGFCDALIDVAPDARATLAGAYEANAGSSSAGSDLALWMHSHLKGFRGILAIDDLHIAQEDREVTRFLTALIDRTKGRVQWMIASRSTLGLPIGTWLAYGDSDLAIDEHDLKFSIDETKEAAKTFRLGVRDEELQQLLQLTDGWPTAISFALRSSTRSIDLRNIASMTRDMIYRYLAEQVYAMLSDEERDFIESASLLSDIDIEVMSAAGFDRAEGMIEELRERVAFIQELRPNHYRMHDLFKEFVQHQLQLRGKKVSRDRRTELAAVLSERGTYDAALKLYVEAKAVPNAVALLGEHGMELIARGHGDAVGRALDAIPQAVHATEPILSGLKGILEIAAGNYSAGERFLQRAIRVGTDVRMTSALMLRLAMLLVNEQRDPGEVLHALLESDASQSAKLEARALLAVRAVRSEQMLEGERYIREVESVLDSVDDVALLAKLLQRLAVASMDRFDHAKSKAYFTRAAELASSSSLWSLASRAYQGLAALAVLADNDVTLSLWYAQQAASAATKAADYYDLQASLLHMLSVETRRGNADRAQQIERQLAELRPNDATRAPYVLTAQAHRHAWRREYADAARLFSSVQERTAYGPDRILIGALSGLCYALGDRAKDASRAVERTLQMLADAPEVEQYGASLYEVAHLFCGLAEAICGRNTSAARILKRAPFFEHESMACLRTAIEELARAARGPSFGVSEDLDAQIEALRSFGFGGYGRYLVLAAAHIESSSGPETTIKLTPSELRIIRSLASGMTTKDIAAEFGRSIYTVQTHIQNLIEKLGCHGRAEAVATARRMGYLEEVR